MQLLVLLLSALLQLLAAVLLALHGELLRCLTLLLSMPLKLLLLLLLFVLLLVLGNQMLPEQLHLPGLYCCLSPQLLVDLVLLAQTVLLLHCLLHCLLYCLQVCALKSIQHLLLLLDAHSTVLLSMLLLLLLPPRLLPSVCHSGCCRWLLTATVLLLYRLQQRPCKWSSCAGSTSRHLGLAAAATWTRALTPAP
jgi:hypothetical protein